MHPTYCAFKRSEETPGLTLARGTISMDTSDRNRCHSWKSNPMFVATWSTKLPNVGRDGLRDVPRRGGMNVFTIAVWGGVDNCGRALTSRIACPNGAYTLGVVPRAIPWDWAHGTTADHGPESTHAACTSRHRPSPNTFRDASLNTICRHEMHVWRIRDGSCVRR